MNGLSDLVTYSRQHLSASHLIASLRPAKDDATHIDLSEIISALSFALDLTEGAVPGHALRSCIFGMRIAHRARIAEPQLYDLYYALLLKDVGCSSNAARMCQIVGGDDRAIKAGVKLEDWTKPHKPSLSTFRLLWDTVLPESTLAERIARIAKIGMNQLQTSEELITLRCDRGASIVRKIGLSDATAEGVRSLDEHWNGSGYPLGLRGDKIPLIARIAAIAQHLDVFASGASPDNAISVLCDRSGQWFDPELVRIAVALHREQKLWQNCLPGNPEEDTRAAALALEPEALARAGSCLGEGDIDRICSAFSEVVDAKSPFTFRHSSGVANAAVAISRTLGLTEERITFVHRAALLHDIGKLGISNSILDKPGRLTSEEFLLVQAHPGLTRQILSRVGAFRDLARIAGEHHEKLDGTGYPNHLGGKDLNLESRIIAVADFYAALSEERPYRAGLDLGEIAAIMSRDVPTKLDPECYEALLTVASQNRIAA
jgi:HD-GYP domain-containing protein (c-di-GMP phosphodiesterase class II)